MSDFVPRIPCLEEAAEHNVDAQDGVRVEALEEALEHAFPTRNDGGVVFGAALLCGVVEDAVFGRDRGDDECGMQLFQGLAQRLEVRVSSLGLVARGRYQIHDVRRLGGFGRWHGVCDADVAVRVLRAVVQAQRGRRSVVGHGGGRGGCSTTMDESWDGAWGAPMGGSTLADELGASDAACEAAMVDDLGPSDALLEACAAQCAEMDVYVQLTAVPRESARAVDGDAEVVRLLMHLGDEAQECGALLHECHRQTRQLASLCEHRHRELASYAEAAERRVRVPRGDDAVWDEAPIYACLESVSSGL